MTGNYRKMRKDEGMLLSCPPGIERLVTALVAPPLCLISLASNLNPTFISVLLCTMTRFLLPTWSVMADLWVAFDSFLLDLVTIVLLNLSLLLCAVPGMYKMSSLSCRYNKIHNFCWECRTRHGCFLRGPCLS